MSITATADLWRMGASELVELGTTKQGSSRELIESHLGRIEAADPPIREDPCLDAASAIEERLGVITPIDPR